MAPFMSERVGDFDKMVPYYTPYSTSMYTYMPTKSNHLSNNQLGAYSYDPNEPRYSKLYKAYFRFFNYNLDRQSHLAQNQLPNVDLNNLARERVRNPQNFNYTQTFDNLPDSATLKTPYYDYFPHKADARRLKGTKPKNKARNLKQAEKIYYNNLFRAETAAALHHEIEKTFSGKKITKKEKKKLMKKLRKSFSSKGNIIKFIDSEFPDENENKSRIAKIAEGRFLKEINRRFARRSKSWEQTQRSHGPANAAGDSLIEYDSRVDCSSRI